MNAIVRILAISAVIALTGCIRIDTRPELLSDWTDELLEDEIMNYYDAITDLKDEQKRRTSPVKTY